MKPKNKLLPTIEEAEEPPPQFGNLGKRGSFFVPENGIVPFYPSLFEKSLTPQQKVYYQTNGHASLIKTLQVEVVSQIDDCYQIWKDFSPGKTLFDTWDFRFAFWQGYRYQPHFIVLKSDEEIFGVMPLWYEDDRKRYTWFGSTWQEENRFLIKDPLFIPLLLAISPAPLVLNAISTKLPSWVEEVIRLKKDDPKYILNLKTIRSVDDYLMTLKKKKRYNLRRDRRIITAQGPKIIIDRFADFESLVNLSTERFHQKGEDADWEDSRRVETFRQVIKFGQKARDYQVRMISVLIRNQLAAVDLIAIYKNCYSPLKCGYDVSNFPGIGNFVNLFEIEDALSLGVEKMDFLEIGYGWKDKWFEAVPLLQYEKK